MLGIFMIRITSSHRRRGTTMIELIVACSLLATLILVVVPSVIRIGQVQRTMRHDRIALDEMSNQLERLTELPFSQINQEIPKLTASEFATNGLPNPQLSGEIEESELGYQIVLQMSWDSPGRIAVPLRMATWIFPNEDVSQEVPEKNVETPEEPSS